MEEKTFFMIKPDAVEKNVIGNILQRLENAGLKMLEGKLIKMERTQAVQLYAEHNGKFFYEELVEYALSGKVFVSVFSWENAVSKVRRLAGATDPKNAAKGTIRADFGTELPKNAVHASDSVESAEREIKIFF